MLKFTFNALWFTNNKANHSRNRYSITLYGLMMGYLLYSYSQAYKIGSKHTI